MIAECTAYLISGLIYSTITLLYIALSGGVPLFYEMVCEISYPVAEGVTNGLLTWLNNITGLIFLLILMIKNIGNFTIFAYFQ